MIKKLWDSQLLHPTSSIEAIPHLAFSTLKSILIVSRFVLAYQVTWLLFWLAVQYYGVHSIYTYGSTEVAYAVVFDG